MAELKIPKLNKNSEKFIFKKKLSLRRKSKRKLLKETLLMLSFSFLIIYLNYLIPNKNIIFINFSKNIRKVTINLLDSLSHFYEIFLVIFMSISFIFTLILILGSFSRILKILKRKTMKIRLK